MIIIDCAQRSSEWYQIRAGIPTASEFSRIIKQNGDPSKSRDDYMYQLAGERLLGTTENGYVSWAMQQGIDREDDARREYEFISGDQVETVGFVYKDEKKNVGCSPDSLILLSSYDYGKHISGLEIKCPGLVNHTKTLHYKKVPPDKWIQIQGNMWVCGFSSWEFVSYHPDMPHPFQLYIETVQRDYKFTSALEHEMEIFLKDLDELYNKIKEE